MTKNFLSTALGIAAAAFALAADIAMLTLGGALKRKEKLSGRFADIISQLYLASSALKRFVSRSQVDVSREGTAVRIRTPPRVMDNG